jgi:hypothetical protein
MLATRVPAYVPAYSPSPLVYGGCTKAEKDAARAPAPQTAAPAHSSAPIPEGAWPALVRGGGLYSPPFTPPRSILEHTTPPGTRASCSQLEAAQPQPEPEPPALRGCAGAHATTPTRQDEDGHESDALLAYLGVGVCDEEENGGVELAAAAWSTPPTPGVASAKGAFFSAPGVAEAAWAAPPAWCRPDMTPPATTAVPALFPGSDPARMRQHISLLSCSLQRCEQNLEAAHREAAQARADRDRGEQSAVDLHMRADALRQHVALLQTQLRSDRPAPSLEQLRGAALQQAQADIEHVLQQRTEKEQWARQLQTELAGERKSKSEEQLTLRAEVERYACPRALTSSQD